MLSVERWELGGGNFRKKILLSTNELMNVEGNFGVPNTFTKKYIDIVEHSEK